MLKRWPSVGQQSYNTTDLPKTRRWTTEYNIKYLPITQHWTTEISHKRFTDNPTNLRGGAGPGGPGGGSPPVIGSPINPAFADKRDRDMSLLYP